MTEPFYHDARTLSKSRAHRFSAELVMKIAWSVILSSPPRRVGAPLIGEETPPGCHERVVSLRAPPPPVILSEAKNLNACQRQMLRLRRDASLRSA
jgi:hypothetical protein